MKRAVYKTVSKCLWRDTMIPIMIVILGHPSVKVVSAGGFDAMQSLVSPLF